MATFDRSLLPAAQLEFAVVADTHYMLDIGDAPLEFESRRKQGRRAGAAWAAVGALAPEFVVHMGDMVQEFPGRPDFERAMAEALGQIEAAGLADRCRYVVGNHDIGDRPDPTMPTGETTGESLQIWEDRFGPSWHTWDAAGWHFVALNSQLLNTSLPAATRQRDWLEAHLATRGDAPCVLFLHMPPYLHDPDEVWLGHYDNLGQPDRAWLLDLVRRHRIVGMFTGHVHFQFFDRLDGSAGACRYFVVPSTSFTRPGFSHLFTGPPPPEQGRDDVPKLGFFLCRLVDGALHVHRVRVAGLPSDGDALLTPVTAAGAAASGFGLGVSLRHPLAAHTEVPVAWPSVVRQPVRNDYPLLACVDAGVERVRVPVADFADPKQARRLQILREEGVALQAVALGEDEALASTDSLRGRVDVLEVQLPGRTAPELEALRRLADAGLTLALCPVLPGQPVAGKQHKRTRHGYVADELPAVLEALKAGGVDAGCVTAACRWSPQAPWDGVDGLRAWPGPLALLAELPGTDDAAHVTAVARAAVVAAALDAPLLLEPLLDLDRTMDVTHGLLDTLCNPRPAYDAARALTALLRAAGVAGMTLAVREGPGWEVAALGPCRLLIPGADGQDGVTLGNALAGDDGLAPMADLRLCRLADASVHDVDADRRLTRADGPLLITPRR